jgi:sigma-E factor negative regulatory protein RseC
VLLETAHVVAVEADSVWVETISRSTCGSCAAQSGCGHSLLNRIAAGRRNYIRAFSGPLAAIDCSVDDHVRICIPEQVIVKGSLLVYMVPLILMLAGAALVSSLSATSTDMLTLVGAVLGFSVGVALVRVHAWYHRSDKSFHPRLMELVNSSLEVVSVK